MLQMWTFCFKFCFFFPSFFHRLSSLSMDLWVVSKKLIFTFYFKDTGYYCYDIQNIFKNLVVQGRNIPAHLQIIVSFYSSQFPLQPIQWDRGKRNQKVQKFSLFSCKKMKINSWSPKFIQMGEKNLSIEKE